MTTIPKEAVQRMAALVRNMAHDFGPGLPYAEAQEAYAEASSIAAILSEIVDPEVLVVRKLCAEHALKNGHERESAEHLSGRWDGASSHSLALAAYRAGIRDASTPSAEPVGEGIAQSDRDYAAEIGRALRVRTNSERGDIIQGRRDDDVLVQMLCQYRLVVTRPTPSADIPAAMADLSDDFTRWSGVEVAGEDAPEVVDAPVDNENLRLRIATAALAGAMANPAYFNHTPSRMAEDAFRAADALAAKAGKGGAA